MRCSFPLVIFNTFLVLGCFYYFASVQDSTAAESNRAAKAIKAPLGEKRDETPRGNLKDLPKDEVEYNNPTEAAPPPAPEKPAVAPEKPAVAPEKPAEAPETTAAPPAPVAKVASTVDTLNVSPGPKAVLTAKGYVSYDEIEDKVFRPLGYEIIEESVPIPKLGFLKEPTCPDIFTEWLKIAKKQVGNQYGNPPREIPADRKNEFLMFGYALERKWYRDDRAMPKPRTWTKIKRWMALPEDKLLSISNYGVTGMSVLHALKNFSIAGQSGIVVGSETPWVEVFALRTGAKEILTVEYQQTAIHDADQVKYIHPIEFAERSAEFYNTFDFALTFSSLEHSGLGRYGDPIDPIGDLREVLKIKCMLKPGGLLFIGFPRGQDCVQYNAHRIYGRIRTAMIMAGFEWMGTFRGSTNEPVILTIEALEMLHPKGSMQDLYVLKKI